MSGQEVLELVQSGHFPDAEATYTLVETHISWVLLSEKAVYKIKKPVAFSFLDFSTVERRKYFCEEELRLNRRLAPDMYLGVSPIVRDAQGQLALGTGAHGAIVDYALHMRRMDDSRQMDRLLLKGGVELEHMDQLAATLAPFHQAHVLLHPAFSDSDNRSDVDDLFGMSALAVRWIGEDAAQKLAYWASVLHRFLEAHADRFKERAFGGFWVEGHGDLHARNIFLLREGPLVFDCIEFSAHFRVLDVLSDLAFLCMDLEAAGHSDLSGRFMLSYLQHWNCMPEAEDRHILTYFKAYRATVRLKVNLLALEQHPDEGAALEARRYWEVVGRYIGYLEQCG